MAPKKKGKGKSKSDDGGGADGDGKKKNAPPTEVEREEMRLKITALEQKLASATARLEAQDAQATEGVPRHRPHMSEGRAREEGRRL